MKGAVGNGRFWRKEFLVALVGLLPQLVMAAPPNIGSGGGSAFDLLTRWMQNFVNFMGGPFGIAVVFVSIVMAFTVWAVVPREGILGPAARAVVAGIVILNAGTWLATLGGM